MSILLDIRVLHSDIFVTDGKRDTTLWEKATSVNGLTSEVKQILFHSPAKIWQLDEMRRGFQIGRSFIPILSFRVAKFLFRNFSL